MVEIRVVSKDHARDLNLKNEPFEMPGRFIPELKDGRWSYRTEAFERVETMVFPDENYDFAETAAKGVILGAYEDGECVGIAIYEDHWLRHMYLCDLKIRAAARGKGIGRMLIEAGMAAARERGYIGLYTLAQDNNLNACLFYLKTGFEIGGFDNRVYKGTKQEGKADIIFYRS